MCYLVTQDDGPAATAVVGTYEAKPDALAAVTKAALEGAENVRLWCLMHSATVRTEVIIADHFKAPA